MRQRKLVAIALSSILVIACSQGSGSNPGDGEGGPDGGGAPGPDARPVLLPPADCAEGADSLYLLGFDLSNPVLYNFHPSNLGAEQADPLSGCPAGAGFDGSNPWGAALNREGIIWAHYYQWDHGGDSVLYDEVFTIDPASSACTTTGHGLLHAGGLFFEFGMTFARDPADPEHDDLYASALAYPMTRAELHTVDPTSMNPTLVAGLVDTQLSYLTATGDGRLFTMYAAGGEFGVRHLELETGAVVEDYPLTGLPNSSGPFVFWGGKLWAFWNAAYDDNELRTNVYRIDLEEGAATKVAELDFFVTAATVSTCAPVVNHGSI